MHAQLSLGGFRLGFLPTLGLLYAEKLDLANSMPLLSGMAVCARPGDQVGATCAQKSHPIGPEWRRSGKSEGAGQSSLAGRFGLAVRVMEINGNHAETIGNQIGRS